MADINQIATAFTQFYYETFDRNRQELAPLYVSLQSQGKKKGNKKN